VRAPCANRSRGASRSGSLLETLLDGLGCRVLKAPGLKAAIAAVADARASPDGLLVDYHLDDGNGIAAIAELRRRFGADLTAILITADRSPHVREEACANGIQLLNKPIKPAALRALLARGVISVWLHCERPRPTRRTTAHQPTE
jgi:CheY-like chemotaxis protein